jgi:hypothetical protein
MHPKAQIKTCSGWKSQKTMIVQGYWS